jgi:hypothetical protein
MVAAELDAGFLEAEGVAVRLLSHSSLPGMPGKTDLLVESAAEHRAIWLLKIPPVSDGELEFLATGEFPKPEDKPGEKP